MARLFEDDLVYPSDREGGRYVELNGPIIAVDEILGDEWGITVKTEKGTFKGWTAKVGSFIPQPGYFAIIRVYDCGGGWYPDSRITSMSTEPYADRES